MSYATYLKMQRRMALRNTEPPKGATTQDPGDGKTGGAGGGAPAPDLQKQLADALAEIQRLKAGQSQPPAKDEDRDLADRARAQRAKDDSDAARTRRIESAIKFDLQAENFVKQHEALLPKEVGDIFRQANQERFDGPIEKDAAIKAGLLQSFFAVQANVDLLTTGQKARLDDYLKLTKTGKQDRAQEMFEMVFEPAFEMLKRTKRAEALSKGHGVNTDTEAAYKKRLVESSRRHYLGEKANGA